MDLPHQGEVDPVLPQQIERRGGKCILPDRAGHHHGSAGPACRERLVRAFAAGQ